MTKTDNRIEWLAVLQGFSMLLVVLGHVTLTNEFMDPDKPLIAALERIIYTFHMPLFIFISGWLFCLTCIRRDVSFRGTMSKKLKRLGIPFLTFTLVAMAVKVLLSSWVRRPMDMQEIVNTFILFSSNPLGEMWFIIVLLILMSIYPVYRWLLRNGAIIWGLCGALLIYALSPEDIVYFQLSRVIRMSVFFIAGVICCEYDVIQKFASRWYVAVGALALFICVNALQLVHTFIPSKVEYMTGAFAGIVLSICICCKLAAYRPGLFGSFRLYTFQIFLLGIFFQMAVRVLYGYIAPAGELAYALLFALSVAVGIYLPVLIAHVVMRRVPSLKKYLGL